MICKWCGAKIDVRQPTCPVCGRETPPLSDCGGIYNLNQGISDSPASAQPPIKQTSDTQTSREGRQSAKFKRRSRWLLVCSMVLLLLFVALLLSLKVDVARQGNDVKQSLDEINTLLSSASEGSSGDAATADVQAALKENDDSTPSPKPSENLAPQTLSFQLNCTSRGAIESFISAAAADLSIKQTSDDPDSTAFNVKCELKGQPWDSWDAEIETSTEEKQIQLSCVLGTQPEIETKSKPSEWRYKAENNGNWVLVENAGEEGFIALDNKGNLLIDASDIPEGFGDKIIVKYTSQVTNTQGDTLEVNIIQTVLLKAA